MRVPERRVLVVGDRSSREALCHHGDVGVPGLRGAREAEGVVGPHAEYKVLSEEAPSVVWIDFEAERAVSVSLDQMVVPQLIRVRLTVHGGVEARVQPAALSDVGVGRGVDVISVQARYLRGEVDDWVRLLLGCLRCFRGVNVPSPHHHHRPWSLLKSRSQSGDQRSFPSLSR